jgi:endo-1,3(4)-beta-glucanase
MAAAAVAAVLAVTVSGCSMPTVSASSGSGASGSGSTGAGSSGGAIFDDATVAPLIAALPQRTVKGLPEARLADGLVPPTNRWFSGLVFGSEPMPVFPLPLSFAATDAGFALGLPAVSTSEKVIMGSHNPAITVDVAGGVGGSDGAGGSGGGSAADGFVVAAYDTASVTLAHSRDGTEIGRTVIAQGSPLVSFTATGETTLGIGGSWSAADGAGVLATEVGGETYGLVTEGEVTEGDVDDGEVSAASVALQPGQTATWFALAEGGDLAEFVAAAKRPITGTTVAYSVGDGLASTAIGYTTDDGLPTLVAAMPHQRSGGTACESGSYRSVYGELLLCGVSALKWTVDALDPSGTLDLGGLAADDRARLAEQVEADVAATTAFPSDTYFGGKALYRAVNLWSIATRVGADAAADELKALVVDALDLWMQPDGCDERASRCFVYDDAAKGIVGLDASFGSDEFNDHHFHYGYFLYAAGVFAADDPELAASWAPVMNLLAADIAADPGPDASAFPTRRVFDAYAGHSWASGPSPFADGNNQESSSEAVNAWNGLALWAAASGQASLQTEAEWLLSAEAASARAYWTDFDEADPVYDGFDHGVTSLVWGGKRDWATWFSPEPSAMLGILVLPMSPVSSYLAGDPDRIRSNLADAAPRGFDVMFGDYLLMYSALAGGGDAAEALASADALNEDRIDDGDSRSYLLAWLMMHARA